MKRYLLDTHALVFWSLGEGLSPRFAARLDRLCRAGRLAVSAVSFWETALLAQKGRIELPASLMPPPSAWGRPGRDGAWWTLNNVYVSNSRATARYNMPGAGTPRLTIDRRSGRITITGSNRYRYTGVCTASMALRPR